MPRYVYRCNSCNDHFQVRHGMKERIESCQLCQATNLTRVPQMPIIKKETESQNQQTGTVTKDFIEQNRELLTSMKNEARSQTYDD